MKLVKSTMALAALILSIGLFSFTNPVDAPQDKVDPTKSTITWKGYKVTGTHEGTIDLKKADLTIADGVLTGGQFVIDMTTITNTDMEGEYKGKLEGHLKSPDFFGVEKFPNATFKITKAVPKGTPGDYKIVGDLTIKETTKEIKFYANVAETDAGYVTTADIKIDRSDFNVKYGSGSFFDNLGDKTIYDEFDLNVTLVSAK